MPRLSLLTLLLAGPLLAQPQSLPIARDGKALVPVVVAADASPRVKQAATDLATYLGKIAGARFEVATGDGTTGIAVGLPKSFPKLGHQDKWARPTAEERENYFITTQK